jgi:hypothetical protein
MVDYPPIAALVNQISVDTWDVLRQIKERRPARMLSGLIDCRTGASQRPERRNYDRQHMSLLGGRRTLGSNHSSFPST